MAWLVSDGTVIASAEVAEGRRARGRGLLGRTGLEGAFVIPRCRWVHTVTMKFPLDIAYLDAEGTIVKTIRMTPHRVGVPVWSASWVVEAEAGAFARWGLHVGQQIELRP
jgi:uncharacterized membrane protein (UPF0127 family)